MVTALSSVNAANCQVAAEYRSTNVFVSSSASFPIVPLENCAKHMTSFERQKV